MVDSSYLNKKVTKSFFFIRPFFVFHSREDWVEFFSARAPLVVSTKMAENGEVLKFERLK